MAYDRNYKNIDIDGKLAEAPYDLRSSQSLTVATNDELSREKADLDECPSRNCLSAITVHSRPIRRYYSDVDRHCH